MSESELPNTQENKHARQSKLYTQTDDMVTPQSFNLTLLEVSVIRSSQLSWRTHSHFICISLSRSLSFCLLIIF